MVSHVSHGHVVHRCDEATFSHYYKAEQQMAPVLILGGAAIKFSYSADLD